MGFAKGSPPCTPFVTPRSEPWPSSSDDVYTSSSSSAGSSKASSKAVRHHEEVGLLDYIAVLMDSRGCRVQFFCSNALVMLLTTLVVSYYKWHELGCHGMAGLSEWSTGGTATLFRAGMGMVLASMVGTISESSRGVHG